MQISSLILPTQNLAYQVKAPAGKPLAQPATAIAVDQVSLASLDTRGQTTAGPTSSAVEMKAEPAAKPPATFDQLLEDLRDAQIVGIARRARGLDMGRVASPSRPSLFAANATELIFRNAQGTQQNVMFDSIGKLSNLTPIVPGETTIPGASISWNRQALTQEQSEKLLGRLYANFARRQSDQQLGRLQEAVNWAAAIVHNGEGQEAVERSYLEGLATVKSLRILEPETYPG